MKRYAFLLILLPMALAMATGCQGPVMQRRQHHCPTCQRMGGGGGRMADGLVSGRYARGYNQEGAAADPGPAAAAVAYPYYTLRGPRDFLTNSPPSIGP
ncbi:MAG: hypothetical protein ACKO38_13705 [Planctomycetota bacterium]